MDKNGFNWEAELRAAKQAAETDPVKSIALSINTVVHMICEAIEKETGDKKKPEKKKPKKPPGGDRK